MKSKTYNLFGTFIFHFAVRDRTVMTGVLLFDFEDKWVRWGVTELVIFCGRHKSMTPD